MRCESCQGSGRKRPYEHGADMPKEAWEPCEDCGGTGSAHCCEGMIANDAPEGRTAD